MIAEVGLYRPDGTLLAAFWTDSEGDFPPTTCEVGSSLYVRVLSVFGLTMPRPAVFRSAPTTVTHVASSIAPSLEWGGLL